MEWNDSPLQYDPRRTLSRGYYGRVFAGSFKGMPVAVRRIQLGTFVFPEMSREADVLSALNHQNVVKLFHVEDRQSFRLFAFELCSASLDDLFRSDEDPKKFQGSMPSEREVLLQIVQGLQHVHSMGFVHKDVKPINILIAETVPLCTVKLGGFGSSKSIKTNGCYSRSEMKGTIGWMAPEIMDYLARKVEFLTLSTISDIFPAGCVLFYYLTQGKHPFGNDGFNQGLNIDEGDPVNFNNLAVDHFAHAIISGMIRRKPSERFQLEDVIQMLAKELRG